LIEILFGYLTFYMRRSMSGSVKKVEDLARDLLVLALNTKMPCQRLAAKNKHF